MHSKKGREHLVSGNGGSVSGRVGGGRRCGGHASAAGRRGGLRRRRGPCVAGSRGGAPVAACGREHQHWQRDGGVRHGVLLLRCEAAAACVRGAAGQDGMVVELDGRAAGSLASPREIPRLRRACGGRGGGETGSGGGSAWRSWTACVGELRGGGSWWSWTGGRGAARRRFVVELDGVAGAGAGVEGNRGGCS